MNPRERRLTIWLGVVLGLGLVLLLVYQYFWKPYTEYGATGRKLADEVQRKEDEIFALLKERPLLQQYRAWSLPAGTDRAAAFYSSYLQGLTKQAHLTDINLLTPTVTEPRPNGPGQTGKKPGHTVLTFQIRAKGELANVVAALEAMRQAPLAHRVKSLTLDRVDATSKSQNPKLNINLVIEALAVNKADARPDNPLGIDDRLVVLDAVAALEHGPTGLATLPWAVGPLGPVARQLRQKEMGERNYAAIARKNIFAGASPPAKPKPPAEPDVVPYAEYVKLDTTDVSGRQAFLRNYYFPSAPQRLRSVPQSGYDTFRITNEDRSKTLLRAKVLRIDQRDVYFQVGEDVYALHIGQSVADAMRRPLSAETLADLELSELVDEEWALKEMQAKQAKAAKGKKGGGRR